MCQYQRVLLHLFGTIIFGFMCFEFIQTLSPYTYIIKLETFPPLCTDIEVFSDTSSFPVFNTTKNGNRVIIVGSHWYNQATNCKRPNVR